MIRDPLVWLSLGTVAAFAALAVFVETQLQAAGMASFDGAVAGYDLAQAQAYLAALSAEQRGLYLGQFRVADTAFPALVTLVLLLWVRRLSTGGLRLALTLLVALYLAADYTENMLVAQLLERGGAGVTDRAVATASQFTQAKWAALAASLGVLVIRALRAGKKRTLG